MIKLTDSLNVELISGRVVEPVSKEKNWLRSFLV